MMHKRLARKKNQSFEGRLRAVSFFIIVFAGILTYRLADLQVLSADELRETALKQQATVRTLEPERGSIYYKDKELVTYPLATNREFNHVYVVPRDVENVSAYTDALLPLLEPFGIEEEVLRTRLGKQNDIYEPLVHKLTGKQLQPFIDLALSGVAWEPENWRYYPEGDTLAHVIGFVGIRDDERVGQYGLEGQYDEALRGQDGLLEGAVDVTGRLIQSGPTHRVDPVPGIDLVLTIDRTVQGYACEQLRLKVDSIDADSGQLIIVNPATGAVIAMCSYPTFDPNNYGDVEDISVYLNPVTAGAYEPGSIFKSVTMAGAIDAGKLTPDTTFVDPGFVEINDYTIRNSDGQAHGEVDMITVLDESLNTGLIFVERQLGNDSFKEYVERFGFGSVTGIELGNEIEGNISSLDKKSDIYFATASFGQGLTVTPMQMVMAYAAIANGGTLMKPYVISEKLRDGEVIERTEPIEVGAPITPRAATILSGMLVSVVESGHAKAAAVKGYYVAGKTGTAQVAGRGGYSEKTIHSFAGFAPVNNPKYAMLIKLDHPNFGNFAASTAAPLFGQISKFLLTYYEVPPRADR